jgi:FOG: Ankyrin repeat
MQTYYIPKAEDIDTAIQKKHNDKVKEFIKENNYKIEFSKENDRYTCYDFLLRAVKAGNAEAAKMFLEIGANPDVISNRQDRPTLLHMAIEQFNVEIVELLLKYGANTDVTNTLGQTPFKMVKEKYEASKAIFELLNKSNTESGKEEENSKPSKNNLSKKAKIAIISLSIALFIVTILLIISVVL